MYFVAKNMKQGQAGKSFVASSVAKPLLAHCRFAQYQERAKIVAKHLRQKNTGELRDALCVQDQAALASARSAMKHLKQSIRLNTAARNAETMLSDLKMGKEYSAQYQEHAKVAVKYSTLETTSGKQSNAGSIVSCTLKELLTRSGEQKRSAINLCLCVNTSVYVSCARWHGGASNQSAPTIEQSANHVLMLMVGMLSITGISQQGTRQHAEYVAVHSVKYMEQKARYAVMHV